MTWAIEQIGVTEANLEGLDRELSELWDLRIPRGLVFPGCQLDYKCLYRLIDLGSLWRITDGEHRVWLDVLDKRHIESIGLYNMANVSFDCEEAIAFEAIKVFLDQFPEQVGTLIPPSVADCELFQFWSRFAEYCGVENDGHLIRYGGVA